MNGIFFVAIEEANPLTGKVRITTRPQEGRTEIGGRRSFWVEPDLLYPLLKGAGDFQANYINLKEELFAFVPNVGIHKNALSAAVSGINHPSLAATQRYMQFFKAQLEQRSTYRLRMLNQGAHFASVFNVGAYTFSPYKLVWPEMAQTFKAAVVGRSSVPLIGRRPYVPDHKIYFVDFDRPAPAYYLSGLLNCPSVRTTIESHIVKLQIGNIFKHVNLPRFDTTNEQHRALARAALMAHKKSSAVERMAAHSRAVTIAEDIIARTCAARSGQHISPVTP